MHDIKGGCHCGNILLDVQLSAAPGTYNPRVCDCDFCRKHGTAWVSDAGGCLSVQIKDFQQVLRYRQGSSQAEFMICKQCGVLPAVVHRGSEGLRAAINARTVDGAVEFGPEQGVSPQKLSASEKTDRWQKVWFAKVLILKAT